MFKDVNFLSIPIQVNKLTSGQNHVQQEIISINAKPKKFTQQQSEQLVAIE